MLFEYGSQKMWVHGNLPHAGDVAKKKLCEITRCNSVVKFKYLTTEFEGVIPEFHRGSQTSVYQTPK